jgi:hypothetical protein
MATKAEIRGRVANIIGITRVNGDLQDQDKVRIDDGYDEVYAQLKKKGLAVWPTDGEVPDDLVEYVAAIMAHNCLDTYPCSPEREQRIRSKFIFSEANIKLLVTPVYESNELPTDY